MLEIRVPAKFGLTPCSHRTAGHLRDPEGQRRVDNGSSGRRRPQRGAPPRLGEAPNGRNGASRRGQRRGFRQGVASIPTRCRLGAVVASDPMVLSCFDALPCT
jgi:hypothetical protein